MIEPETEVVKLHSRLGRVGSIQAWDPWKSRQSVAHAKWWVSKVASLSYGNDAAKNPEALFQSIVDKGHVAVLEFVPLLDWDYDGILDADTTLPAQSLRNYRWGRGADPVDTQLGSLPREQELAPATAFLVECPIYVRSQWMRHRSFAYLEMSRRYTKGSKVAWEYYGHGTEFRKAGFGPDGLMQHEPTNPLWNPHSDDFHAACEAEYRRRLDAGWPNEIARGCMPMEAMTKFYVAGFDRDWEAFLKLRNDAHAQPEIRVFAQWIQGHLDSKSASIDAGNLGN